MPTRIVNLTGHFDGFIASGVASGRSSIASEAVLEWLRAAAKDGFDDIERGDYATLRSGKEIDDLIGRLMAET